MREAANGLAQRDPIASKVIIEALEAEKKSGVGRQQSGAANAVLANRELTAFNFMIKARQGFEDMQRALGQEEKYRLSWLALQLGELIDILERIRASETALHGQTLAEGPALPQLGQEQARLQQHTTVQIKRAEALQFDRLTRMMFPHKKEHIVGAVRGAATAMSTAAGALLKSARPQALEPEKQAIAELEKAIRELKERYDLIAREQWAWTLEELRKEYEAIRGEQEKIKGVSDAVAQRVAAQTPADAAALDAQAGIQGQLGQKVTALSGDPSLKSYDVLVWINAQIVEEMNHSQQKLARSQVGPQLAAVQQTALDRLTDIIEALKAEQGRIPFAKVPSEPGPSNSGPGTPPFLLPTAQQLKMLKSQQVVVNRATADSNQQLAAASTQPEKARLGQQVKSLGLKQQQLQELTRKLLASWPPTDPVP